MELKSGYGSTLSTCKYDIGKATTTKTPSQDDRRCTYYSIRYLLDRKKRTGNIYFIYMNSHQRLLIN